MCWGAAVWWPCCSAPVSRPSKGANGDSQGDGDGAETGDGDDAKGGDRDCSDGRVVSEVRLTDVDKVDLLFVVDNSRTMEAKQRALQAQFPRLIRTLTSGQRVDAGGDLVGAPFPPVTDLHLGIVTSDMGPVATWLCPGDMIPSCKSP